MQERDYEVVRVMGEYKVIREFYDLREKKRYKPGDPYFSDDEARIKELSTNENRQGAPVIAKSETGEGEEPKKGKKAKNDPD